MLMNGIDHLMRFWMKTGRVPIANKDKEEGQKCSKNKLCIGIILDDRFAIALADDQNCVERMTILLEYHAFATNKSRLAMCA